MQVLDQYSAVAALEKDLVPCPSMIDGRSEQDWLSFLSRYASLINFYDNTNSINGNWMPFLLKDPVFLLATLSKTSYTEFHSLYLNTCNKLSQLLDNKENNDKIHTSFNQLFDQLILIFMHIKRWVYFMQRSDDEYPLKTYAIEQVQINFSKYFWAVVSLRQNLFLSSAIKGIEPVDHIQFQSDEFFEEKIWKQNKDKSPYWEVLQLKHPIKDNTVRDFFRALKKAGDDLFDFFHSLIKHSSTEFEKVKLIKSSYPDTTLLRTFVHLLNIYQDQLNGLAGKHLEFYYKDILKQRVQPADPDKAYLFATLAKSTAVFSLPAGTAFAAGMDAEKKPVTFVSNEKADLNPVVITGAYTLACQESAGLSSLHLQNIPAPGLLQKDDKGKVLDWETFGGNTTQVTPLGMAFASPLLLLREGTRSICLTLMFNADVDLSILQRARYYLSTQQTWLSVSAAVVFPANKTVVSDQVNLQIDLGSNEPPIEPFLKNPDGLSSSWPMLKMEYDLFSDLSAAPVITKLIIEVNVQEVKTFQLYNDSGALSTKTPFPVFGTTPVKNSNFIIGNNELFSKPLNTLEITLDWDHLPPDFLSYYQPYNNFLEKSVKPVQPPAPTESAFVRSFKALFGISDLPPLITPVNADTPFNNFTFLVKFKQLQDQSWCDLQMPNKLSHPPVTPPPVAGVKEKDTETQLFTAAGIGNALESSSVFSYANELTGTSNLIADPTLQNAPLKYTGSNSSGFIKMILTSPEYGFGSALYPNVVSNIALYNALILYRTKSNADMIPAAYLPFSPKAKQISATYTATQCYDLNAPTGTYPLQCFLYSPFENFLEYDNTRDSTAYSNDFITAIAGTKKVINGVPLYTTFDYKGVLFLEMENLVPAASLNLYFELARKYGVSTTGKAVDYFYLSNEGWKKLSLLADGTNDFNCTGIVTLNVPADISNTNKVMPPGKFWFCIAVKNDPGSFAHTVLVQPNGIKVQRSETSCKSLKTTPLLSSKTITATQVFIPQIAAVTQPFPSFGGRAPESQLTMNRRVSNRIKTKDRANSREDYFRLIRQEYNDIYYSRSAYNPLAKRTEVYVVKAYESWKDAGAFIPMISECREEEIQQFLTERASLFTNIQVFNFIPESLKVNALVSLQSGFEASAMREKIELILNVFLSPWIKSEMPQLPIDQGISEAQVTKTIKNIPGVAEVESLSFQFFIADKVLTDGTDKQTIFPSTTAHLFVSAMHHNIQINPGK